MLEEQTCGMCGASLDGSEAVTDLVDQNEGCPECGRPPQAFERAVIEDAHASATSMTSMSVSVRSPNTSVGRLEALDLAIEEAEQAVHAGDNHLAQAAVKRALEAIHELDDASRNRHEWSSQSWTTEQRQLLRAHVGARNVAHHYSVGIVELCNDGQFDERLLWEIADSTLARLPSEPQRAAFRARLKRKPVLPNLRALGDLLRGSIN
jgi:hypothetical protein